VRDPVEALARMPEVELELFAFEPGGASPYVRAMRGLRRLRPGRFGGRITFTAVGICLGTVAIVYVYAVAIGGGALFGKLPVDRGTMTMRGRALHLGNRAGSWAETCPHVSLLWIEDRWFTPAHTDAIDNLLCAEGPEGVPAVYAAAATRARVAGVPVSPASCPVRQ